MLLSSARRYWRAVSGAFADTVGIDRLGFWQKILFAFSAANLNLIGQWRSALYASPADQFYFFWPPNVRNLAALLAFFALLAFAIFLAVRAIYFLPARWKTWAMVLFVVFLALNPFDSLRQLSYIDFFRNEVWIGLAVLALAVSLVLAPRLAPTVLVWIALILSPLVALNVARALLAMPHLPPAPISTATVQTARLSGTERMRVVWLLFDELDHRILRQHPDDLPNFRRLFETSIVASNATPAGGDTLRAVPALLIGKPVLAAKPAGPERLMITAYGRYQAEPLRAAETVFSRLTSKGARVAISGWAFPYCRLFGAQAAWCKDRMLFTMRSHVARTLLGDVGTWALSALPLGRRRNAHVNYNRMAAEAREVASGSYDFVYMHVSVPHPPWYWEPERTDMLSVVIEAVYDTVVSKKDGYSNNLRHADDLLGRLLKAFEESPAWKRTALIVSSDHGLRVGIEGLPSAFEAPNKAWGSAGDVALAVRLPMQTERIVIDEKVDALNTPLLVEELWSGRAKNSDDVRRILTLPVARPEPLAP